MNAWQCSTQISGPEPIQELAEEFWRWRAQTQPDSGDDLPRIERPSGWVADWSPAAVEQRRGQLAEFVARHRHSSAHAADLPVPAQVDIRLLGSAIARVQWELDHLRSWRRNPGFYVDQTLGPLYRELLSADPSPAIVLRHLQRIPATIGHAMENLSGHAAEPFARAAIRLLERGVPALGHAMDAFKTMHSTSAPHIGEATQSAQAALAGFRDGLCAGLNSNAAATTVPDMSFLLHRVALLPYSLESVRRMARQEWNRAVGLEAVLLRRPLPQAQLPRDVSDQIARHDRAEQQIRRFYTEGGILGQPGDLRRYLLAPMPAYLAPLTWLGVPNNLGCERENSRDAVRYIPDPHARLSYFQRADAIDPRLSICHEGVHAQQLALSARHPNPVRRRFYDSVPNEGIAFYNEELMLSAGLFADAPESAALIANFMRLRALRTEIDLDLASGLLSIDQAARRLTDEVPMDPVSAWEEAVMFAGCPGQGLSYQVGKLQILDLLAACSDRFTLQEFHDRLWREGNIPLALQRWELLGLRDQVDAADHFSKR